MNKAIASIILFCFSIGLIHGKDYIVSSPDHKIQVKVSDGKELSWSVNFNNETILKPSRIAMTVKEINEVFGINVSAQKVNRRSVDEAFEVVVPTKFRKMQDNFNEMTLTFKGGYAVTFRVYNNGAAYRFETSVSSQKIHIENETVEFNLGGNYSTYWPKESSPNFITHCEGHFDYISVSDIPNQKYAYLPIYLSSASGTKMVIMEADLFDYPNLFLSGTATQKLNGVFPPVILEKKIKEGSDRNEDIVLNAAYIAKTEGKRNFPWRLLIIGPDDKSLLENNLVYQLSTPGVAGDKSWIKPGRISWDWWSTLNIYDVDFEAGVNTRTYKYFIDFAAKYGLEYILLDEGWSAGTWNIREPNKDVDVQELVRYGKTKNVGLVLWALWNPLHEDLEGILDLYKQWGIKGVKIDFMQRNDQEMVNFYENVGKAAFDRQLLVDFHGSFKPSGLHRKYPNVMTYEGVYGLEHNKSSHDISPNHDLILPFTRMVAGPMDYTPGATVNATENDFHMNFIHPMSQGTRAHQGALFIAFESPLQMFADSPSNYYKTSDFTSFIAQIPTVWDETRAIEAEAGKYLTIARRSGSKWFIASLTNWDQRELSVNLNFIGEGKYKAEILRDGVNANRYGSDFKIETKHVSGGQTLDINMAKGGGWAAILTPVE
ncbi:MULTISPECIES: glycoside hydrolase family 97 protein [unclassified Dysgonomonas]|jgi:alpha-glucosidase|uniref:glycoside hydrolase family 97 protein n=1 Tax=unclassified Dysgonomonas TaxID=2630389 RepID=UPI0025B8770B|nr:MULTISPECIES: glycoside hydrolase family 97 protein [unclassified Dysgonomonas]MDR2002328.1 glycoside hydrolase family 97 protein [Prevotella sp.]HMM01762.1 glycoside hydrolase family 97 protein [Dysgonomonas sp.]